MLSCNEALELLSARLDGALSPEETAQLEEHLAGCGACRDAERDLALLCGELSALAADPPSGLKDEVLSAIRQAPVGAGGTGAEAPSSRHGWRRWRPLAAAVILILAGAGGLTVFLQNNGSSGAMYTASTADMASDAVSDQKQYSSEENSDTSDAAPAQNGSSRSPDSVLESQAAGSAPDALPEQKDAEGEASSDETTPESPASDDGGTESTQEETRLFTAAVPSGLTQEEAAALLADSLSEEGSQVQPEYLGLSQDGTLYLFLAEPEQYWSVDRSTGDLTELSLEEYEKLAG